MVFRLYSQRIASEFQAFRPMPSIGLSWHISSSFSHLLLTLMPFTEEPPTAFSGVSHYYRLRRSEYDAEVIDSRDDVTFPIIRILLTEGHIRDTNFLHWNTFNTWNSQRDYHQTSSHRISDVVFSEVSRNSQYMSLLSHQSLSHHIGSQTSREWRIAMVSLLRVRNYCLLK